MVEDETAARSFAMASHELLGGAKLLNIKTLRLEKYLDRVTNNFVIIDDEDGGLYVGEGVHRFRSLLA